MYVLHPGMSSGPGSTQIHGVPGDTFTSPEYSTDSVDSQSHTKLSLEDIEEESKHQGSKVSNARPFTHKSLVTTHQDVTCASFSPTIQVPTEPAEGESDPHEEPEPATVKGECRVAVCLSMLVPTTSRRKGNADMLHHSLPTLATALSGLPVLVHSTYGPRHRKLNFFCRHPSFSVAGIRRCLKGNSRLFWITLRGCS